MSLLRRRLLILAAMNNGLPNMPVRFKTGERAVFSDGKHGYFSMDRRFVRRTCHECISKKGNGLAC